MVVVVLVLFGDGGSSIGSCSGIGGGGSDGGGCGDKVAVSVVGDSFCKGGSCNSCRRTIVKSVLVQIGQIWSKRYKINQKIVHRGPAQPGLVVSCIKKISQFIMKFHLDFVSNYVLCC